ncbi:MAG: hypothetical protein ACI83B_001308 [Sediminicola sp.]|jgi:hypothetical protein
MKKLLCILSAFLTIIFSSCESETSILGTQDFTGSVDEMRVIVGTDAYDKFTSILEIPIYEGNNPPSLNGEYIFFQILQTADAIDPNSPVNGNILGGLYLKIQLSNQDIENGKVDYLAAVWAVGEDQFPGTEDDEFLFFETALREVFVFGSVLPDGTGGFNLFAEGEVDGNAENTDTIALSGFGTSEGVIDFKYAFVSFDIRNTINAGNTWKDSNSFSPKL